MEVATVKITDLKRSGKNVRKTAAADHETAELVASIRSLGLLHNLVVKKNGKGYEVIDGGRRLEALRKLKMEEAPCLILDDADAGEVSVAANIIRADLHPMDEAAAIAALVGNDESVPDIANRFGHTEKWVRQRMQLNNLDPRIQKLFREGEVSMSDATQISSVPLDIQKQFIDENDGEFDTYEFRHVIRGDRINGNLARFDPDELTSEEQAELDIRRDLFRDDMTFGNRDAFVRHQKAWLEKMKDKWLGEGYDNVVITSTLVWEYDRDNFEYSHHDPSQPVEDMDGNLTDPKVSKGSVTVFYRLDDGGRIDGPAFLLPKKIDPETGEVKAEAEEEVKEPTPSELTAPQWQMLSALSARLCQNAIANNPKLADQMIIATTLRRLKPGLGDTYASRFHEFKVMPEKQADNFDDLGIEGPKSMIHRFLPEALWDAMANRDEEAYENGIRNLFGGWANFMSSGNEDTDRRMAAAAIAMKVNPDGYKAMLKAWQISPDWMERAFLSKYRVSQLQQIIAEMGGTTENVRKKDLVEDIMRLWAQGKRFRFLPDEYMTADFSGS